MVDTISLAVADLAGDFLLAGGVGLGVGITVFALVKGWATVRWFINDTRDFRSGSGAYKD